MLVLNDFHSKMMLEVIREKCTFLWVGNRERDGIPLVKWQSLSKHKEVGRWGLENIHYFGQGLVAKRLWKIISNKGLWRQVILHKILNP